MNMHFFNMFNFEKMRRKGQARRPKAGNEAEPAVVPARADAVET